MKKNKLKIIGGAVSVLAIDGLFLDGSYGVQEGDGVATITSDEQVWQTVEEILNMVK